MSDPSELDVIVADVARDGREAVMLLLTVVNSVTDRIGPSRCHAEVLLGFLDCEDWSRTKLAGALTAALFELHELTKDKTP